MAAENEIVKLALGGISSLASILSNYDLPKDMEQVVNFTVSNFNRLQKGKAANMKIEPKVSLSKDTLANQIVMSLWYTLCIGRIYNGLYLKGKKPRDFIRETISYDKELKKENADETNKEGTTQGD